MRSAYLVGVVGCALGFVGMGLGCSSSNDDSGGTGGMGATGGAGPTKNVFVSQIGLPPSCLPRPLTPDATARVPCGLVEVRSKSTACACDASEGRLPVTDATNVVPNVETYLRNVGQCGAQATPSCSAYCFCEIRQFTGAELLTCEGAATDPGTLYGFCYVDPAVDSNGDGTPDANPALLADCKDTEKRELRFLGADLPASDALLLLACEGATAAN